jgi:protein-S-isoprenylcysteine O-methyltransferase Ste14
MTLQAKMILRFSVGAVILAALLFLPAGTFRFWQGWVYLVTFVGTWTAFTFWLLQANPQLMERRLRVKETDPAQKLFQIVWTVIFFPALILTGFDFRFGWSQAWLAPVPLWAALMSDALALAGCAFIIWAMKTNTYASRTIQVEAGQTVVTTGPYRIVRHPFYSGVLVWILATPFALGSYVAVPLFLLMAPVLIYRLVNEEKLLRRDLPGYAEYCNRTQFRLIPGVW